MEPEPTERLPSLDSLRGVAAFIVLLSHCSLLVPDSMHAAIPQWLAFTPFRLLYSGGYASVVLFFVLSGYVLSFPYLGNTPPPPRYMPYLLKRICRIYIPFAFAILFAVLLYFCSPPLTPGQGNKWLQWFCHAYTEPVSWPLILRHWAMTGIDSDMWLDGVMWSLVYELRISLIFPLLVLLSLRLRTAIISTIALYILACFVALNTGNGYALQSAKNFIGSILLTLRFISFFIIGTILARYNEQIMLWLRRMPRWLWLAWMMIALEFFSLPKEIRNQHLQAEFTFFNDNGGFKYVTEFIIGIASCMLIVSARNMPSFSKFLNIAPTKWLGKVSYSLYLVHMPIAFLLFLTLLGSWHPAWIILLVIAVSLIFAEIFHQLVERPSMHLGRSLAKKFG